MHTDRFVRLLCACVLAAFVLCCTTSARASQPFRFVEPAAAATHLDDLRVIDARSIGAYLGGHVPGAVHLDDERLRGSRSGVPGVYVAPEEAAAIFGQLGVELDAPVLVYASQGDPLAATMVAYALLRIGHADVRVLSGGFEAWRANHPVEKEFPEIEQTQITPRSPLVENITYDQFEDSVGHSDRVFLDARPIAQYLGDAGIWRQNGHIPGAHSLHWERIAAAHNTHRLRPRAEIEAIIEELGVSEWDQIVVYCGTGREATLLTLALRFELGLPNVRMYEGSWTEYSSIEGAPVEVGPRTEPTTRVFSDGRIGVSAQPTKRTLRELAENGVAVIVNCRSEREVSRLDFDQREEAERLGMRHAHIPMGGVHGYNPDQVRAFAEVYREAEGRVVLHCASGGRARSLWLAYLVEYEGVSPEEAWGRIEVLGGDDWSFDRLLGSRVRFELDAE